MAEQTEDNTPTPVKKCSTLILIDFIGKLLGQCKQQNLKEADVDHIIIEKTLLSEVATQVDDGKLDVSDYKCILLQLASTDVIVENCKIDTFIADYGKVIYAIRSKNESCCIVVSNMWGGEKAEDDESVRIYNMALKNFVIGLDSTKIFLVENEKAMKSYRKEVKVYEEDKTFTENAMTRIKQRFITRLNPWRVVITRPKLDPSIDFCQEIKSVVESRSLVLYPVALATLDQPGSEVRKAHEKSVSSTLLLGGKTAGSVVGFLYMRFSSAVDRNSVKQDLEKAGGELKVMDAKTCSMLPSNTIPGRPPYMVQFLLDPFVLDKWQEEYNVNRSDTQIVCHSAKALMWVSTHPELSEADLRWEFPTAIDAFIARKEDGTPSSQAYLQFENYHVSGRCKRHFMFKGEKLFVSLQPLAFGGKRRDTSTMTDIKEPMRLATKQVTPKKEAALKKEATVKKEAAIKKEGESQKSTLPSDSEATPTAATKTKKPLTIDISDLFLPKTGTMESSMKSRVKGTLNRCNQLLINGKEKTPAEEAEINKALKHCEAIITEDDKRRKKMQVSDQGFWGPSRGNANSRGTNRGGGHSAKGGTSFGRGRGNASQGGGLTSPGGYNQGGMLYSSGNYSGQMRGMPQKRQAPIGRAGRGLCSGPRSKMPRQSAEQYGDYAGELAANGRSDKLIGTLEGLVSTLGTLFGNRGPTPEQPQRPKPKRSPGEPTDTINNSLLNLSGNQPLAGQYGSAGGSGSVPSNVNYSTDVDFSASSDYTNFAPATASPNYSSAPYGHETGSYSTPKTYYGSYNFPNNG